MDRFLVHWLVAGLALAITARSLPAYLVDEAAPLVVGAGVFGLANAVVGALLRRADIDLTPVSAGLLLLAVNVVAFGVAAGLLVGFPVGELWQIGLGALIVTTVSWPLTLSRFSPRADPA